LFPCSFHHLFRNIYFCKINSTRVYIFFIIQIKPLQISGLKHEIIIHNGKYIAITQKCLNLRQRGEGKNNIFLKYPILDFFTQKKKEENTMKGLIKLLAVTAIICMIPFTAFSMQMISDNEMDNITGQSGITIVFAGNTSEGALSIDVSLRGLAWGDTDGIGGDTLAGYFTMDGQDADTGAPMDTSLSIKIKHLSKMTLDVGTTNSTNPVKVDGTDVVPVDTSFIKMGVPDLVLSVNMADEGKLCLSNQSAGGSSEEMGTLSLTNLGVGLTFPANSALYIYAH